MTLSQLKERIAGGNTSGAYFFFGEEEYTKDHYRSQICRPVDDSAFAEMNHVVFDMTSATLPEVAEACDALPFMAERRLVELRSLLPAGLNETDAGTLTSIVSGIHEQCTLLVICRADECDPSLPEGKRTKQYLSALFSAFEQSGGCVRFDRAKPAELVTWLLRHFSARNVKVTGDAVRLMIDMCGTDMYVLNSEVQKLCAVLDQVSEEDVRKICCANDSFAVYDYSRMILARDFEGTDKALDSLLASGIQPPQILATLTKRYAELSAVRAALDSKTPYSRIAANEKMAEWAVRRCAGELSGLSRRRLSFMLRELQYADSKMKSSSEDKVLVLKVFAARAAAYDGE